MLSQKEKLKRYGQPAEKNVFYVFDESTTTPKNGTCYGNVTNRMVNYLQAKGIQERYDRKVSAKIRQGRSARGLSNG